MHPPDPADAEVALPSHRARTGLARDLLICAGAGGAVLVAEFAAVRIAAPWFGQSSYVWANAVGVVLLALAIGYAVGGRLADRDPGGRWIPALLGLAGLWLGAASRVGAPLAAWLVPMEVGADRPLLLGLWGSLALSAALLGPPLALLGAVSPMLVRRACGSRGIARAAGALSAAGTFGSLVGCAAAPLWVLPALGARGALAATGLGLGALGVLAGRSGRAAASAGPRAGPPRRPGHGMLASRLLLAAAVVGVSVTGVEFAVARALAPAYGASNPVWASILAGVLLALALGNAAGGRVSDAAEPGTTRRVLWFGAAWLALASWGALRVHVLGGFATALLLVGPPLVACGATTPVLTARLATGWSRGRSAGAVLAANTLGCLVGCYLAPLVALQAIGTEKTLLCAALSLGVAAVLCGRLEAITDAPEAAPASDPRAPPDGLAAPRGRLLALAVAVVCAVLLGTTSGALRTDPGQVLELETGYQTVRLIEASEPGPLPGPVPLYGPTGEMRVRFLRFDEDSTSYQSVRVLDDEEHRLTAGRYYDHLALGAWFAGQPWSKPGGGDPRVLIVGYCGGTLHRVLGLVAPEGRLGPDVVGVELDPDVARLGRQRLGEVPGRLDLATGEDGRTVVDRLPKEPGFDLILVDAYARTQYVPFQLATREFFEACRERLTPSGALGVNVNSPGGLSGALLGAVAATLSAAFPGGGVWLVPNPQYDSNVAVWATRSPVAPRVAGGAPPSLSTPAFALDRLLVRWVRPSPEAAPPPVLVDDLAPVERLADRDLLRSDGR